jgi:4a-hydroxytetrahydrobiopterin dehydratase
MSELAKRRCIPCEKGMPPLLPEKAQELAKELHEWMLVDGARMLAKSFTFKNFKQAIAFINEVARIAEEEGHHPDLTISYNNVGIELWTHAIDGLSENDFILAAKIDEIKK